MRKTKLCTGLMVAFGGVLISAGPAAIAQTTAPAQSLERVEVTGSNIKRTDSETASPVQVITSADLVKSGYTTVSEVLQNITANGQGTLSQSFNQAFAAGASGISLRGLTVGATLVLIDGKRMAPYPLSDDGQRPFVDISSIPFAAVERIEILKDGASAIYGSDAIAGVVNVILKRNFKGTGFSADLGTTQHGGGATKSASIIHGFTGDNPDNNGYIAFEYRKQNEILLDQRSGEFTRFDWRPYGGLDLRPGAANDVVSTPRLATPYYQNPANSSQTSFAPGCASLASARAGNCTYTNTWAQLQPATENMNLLGKMNVAINNDWNLTMTGSYFQSKAQQTRNPATVPLGSFAGYTVIGPGVAPVISGALNNYTVPVTYPGNTLGVPANVRALALGTTPRTENVTSGSSRLVADLNGNVAGIDVNATGGYTRVRTSVTYRGYVDNDALYTALNNTTDPFLLAGGNSQANINRVSPTVEQVSTDELWFAGLHGSKELMKLPGGNLGIAGGVDYRKKKLYAPPTGTAFLTNTFAIGEETNRAAYIELSAPVLKTLELNAAYRYDHYDTYGSSTTPKVGFKFTPVPEFAVRGTASKGFRAPSATENGSAGSLFSFNAIRDPILCPVSSASGSPNLTSPQNVPAQCAVNPTYLQGTSKSLQPEKSKSYTLGLIFEPIQNWSNTLDYYQIQIDNQIIPAASLAGFDPLAFAVRATPQTVTYGDGTTGLSSVGPIQYVTTPYVNGQTTKTSGLELESRYRFKVAQYGAFLVGFQISHTLKYDQTINGSTYHLAGTHGPSIIGGNTGNPRDRAQLTLGWDYNAFNITSTTNYVGHYSVTDPSVGYDTCLDGINGYNSQFANGATPPSQFCKVGAFVTTNLSMQYKVSKGLTLRGTVLNLFDRKPPVDLSTYGGTGSNSSSNGTGAPYNPSLHQAGAVGRYFSVGANYNF